MRKTLIALSAAAALTATAASPVLAQSRHHHHHHHHNNTWVAPAAGVVAGTVFGVGLHEGWWGTAFTADAASVGGSIAGGFIVGVAATALIHAATTKCTGFHALAGGSGCVNGQYVGR
jgi:uncharacterized membrane protein